MAEIKMKSVSYPGMAYNFKCTPCKISFKTDDELMDNMSQMHFTEAHRLGTGFQKYNNQPLCRNGNQCRYHKQNRCTFFHNSFPQKQQFHHFRQAPSNQWNSVPQKQHTSHREHRVHQTRQQQAQTHRYWETPPLWIVSGDQRPWCLHGTSCPMGNYCILRHEDEQDFSNWSPQGQQ